MKHITLILIIGLSLFSSFHLNAQREGGKKEKLHQMKIAFLTDKMDLSTEDAQRFWPIYNKHNDQLAALRKHPEHKAENRERGERGEGYLDVDSMTELEAKTYYTQHLDRQQQKLEITLQMVTELEKSFSSKQILNYLYAEEKFKKQVLSKVKEKMKEKRSQEEK